MSEAAELTSVELAAKLFRGLADPTRLGVLLALQGRERRVVDLVAELGTSQANVSGHLACLRDCGLVADRIRSGMCDQASNDEGGGKRPPPRWSGYASSRSRSPWPARPACAAATSAELWSQRRQRSSPAQGDS